MQPVDQNDWHGEVIAQLFGCIARPSEMINSMISNVIWQGGFMTKGRTEIFSIVYSRDLLVRPDSVPSCMCLYAIICCGILICE